MSVRAYKVIKKELNDAPSFNLWHDNELINMLQRFEGYDDSCLGDGCGSVQVKVSAIKKTLKKFKFEDNDYRKIQLEEDIEGKDDEDWIEYECF